MGRTRKSDIAGRREEAGQTGETPKTAEVKKSSQAILREEFRRKLEELSVTRDLVARFFGVSESTLAKWEEGITERGSLVLRRKLREFLDGSYDRWFNGTACDSGNFKYSIMDMEEPVQMCMERITRAYNYCAQSPVAGKQFISIMDAAAVEMLRKAAVRKREV